MSLVSAAMVLSIRRSSPRSSPIILFVGDRRRLLADLFFLLASDRPLALLASITVTLSGRVKSGLKKPQDSRQIAREERSLRFHWQ
jgi:hypothetical protein